MPRSTTTTLALPPFSGATRRLILISVGVFFAKALLAWVLTPVMFSGLFNPLALVPVALVHGQVWQPLTYVFMPSDIIGTLFTMLFLWFIGSMLEDVRGSRWLYEIFFTSAIGGALLASAIAYTHIFHLSELAVGFGPYAGIYGLLIAVVVLMGDQEFLFFFLIRIKARYMVAIYILVDTARLLLHENSFDALLHLSGALCGYLFLKFAGRRGFGFSFSERYYALRNDYYRGKRRRAARKFEVYMGKQGRQVHFDKDGRYMDPDEVRKDPNDKRWMN